MQFRWVDEFEAGFGWLVEEVRGRTSHALVADGSVWLVDPVDVSGLEERVRSAGQAGGVIQLLDRHNRNCAALAERLDVRHLRVPRDSAGTPFAFLPLVDMRGWREVALWWEDRQVLVCADALGTLPYFLGRGDRLGVNPSLRLTPPPALRLVEPRRILVGHGEGVHEDAAQALQEALSTSRRRMPGAAWNGLRYLAGAVRRR